MTQNEGYLDLVATNDIRDLGENPTPDAIAAELQRAIDRTDSLIRQLSESRRMVRGTHCHEAGGFERLTQRYDRLVMALCEYGQAGG